MEGPAGSPLMPTPQELQQDQDFLKASPQEQHAYLMSTDPDYAKAPQTEQQAYLKHLAQPLGFTQGEIPQPEKRSSNQTLKDYGIGASQGAANTVGNSISGISRLLNKIPYIGETLAPSSGIHALESRTQDVATPQNEDQAIGKTGEQVAEWLLPLGKGKALGVAPKIMGRAGPILERLALSAGEGGLRNASQGGSFTTGAELGAGGEALGAGMKKIAPSMVESALGISKRLRGYGKTPGEAALAETRGIFPSTIEKSAQKRLSGLTQDIESMAAGHRQPVTLKNALDTIDNEIARASAQNNGTALRQLGEIRGALTREAASGLPIPQDVPATRALSLKRGLRNQFVTNWNPEMMHGTRAVAANASRDIDQVLDNALGRDFASKNQRISSLIPVAERAESVDRSARIPERVLHRIGAHTGAAAGGLIGAGYGYNKGGLEGAVKYGLGGVVLPEVLASPSAQMLAARTLNSRVPVRLLRGAAAQLDRPKLKDYGSKE